MTIDFLSDVYNVATVVKCIPTFIFILPAAGVGLFLYWLFKKLWGTKPNIKTKSIVILGTKASGKTTLWNRLKGYKFSGEYKVTALDKVEKFIIEKAGKAVEIESTKDIGGGDSWVTEYDKIIKKDTFILYLVNATDLIEKAGAQPVRSRIQKIQNIIYNNRLENVGFRIYITHTDKFLEKNPDMTDAMLIIVMKKYLDLESIKVKNDVKYEYTAVNLISDSDIDTIKKDIIDKVYE